MIILEEKNKSLEGSNRELLALNKNLEKEVKINKEKYVSTLASGFLYKVKIPSLFYNQLYQVEIRKNLNGESVLFFENDEMSNFHIKFSQIRRIE